MIIIFIFYLAAVLLFNFRCVTHFSVLFSIQQKWHSFFYSTQPTTFKYFEQLALKDTAPFTVKNFKEILKLFKEVLILFKEFSNFHLSNSIIMLFY